MSTPDDNADWYWPSWAAAASLPTFDVLDTESSLGRYAPGTKRITVKDLVRFHGHPCDGLFRGVFAMRLALDALRPDGIADRTDLRVLSRNSPCLGDVAAYLTGARVRFGTQDVRDEPGVWYLVQQASTGRAVRVRERAGVYPADLFAREARMTATRHAEPGEIDDVRRAQAQWVQDVLLARPAAELYELEVVEAYDWSEVPYAHRGPRTDVLFKGDPGPSRKP
jgi:formylmethanofuran dehydrogenase subunit E